MASNEQPQNPNEAKNNISRFPGANPSAASAQSSTSSIPNTNVKTGEQGYIAPGEKYPTTAPGSSEAPYDLSGLGNWNYYFVLKLALFWRGNIGFHTLENLAFAAFLLISFSSKIGRAFKAISAFIMGIALFYYDTYLPPIRRAVSQFDALKDFSFEYYVELAMRYISLEFIALAFLLYIAVQYADRLFRTSVIVFCTLVVLAYGTLFPSEKPLIEGEPTLNGLPFDMGDTATGGFSANSTVSLDEALNDFYAIERKRKVPFSPAPTSASPFDVLVLNICSLSWDDLHYTGLHQHPVLSQFDIMLSNFSSAASYSGPAAIRLMRSSCGQGSHSDLYKNVGDECFLMDNLVNAGYERELFMNHDGNFDNFLPLLNREGHFTEKPIDTTGVDIAQYSFDGTPILSDLSSLNLWLQKRNDNDAERVVAYYNSISLHDGNRLAGEQSNLNSLENFHPRMTTILTELDLFFEQLKSSNRRVMVVMVPEHGAAARGDAMQAAAFREIPSPTIAHIPVGIRFFGPEYNQVAPQNIEVKRPASHLAVSHFIASAIKQDPYQAEFKLETLLSGMPETNFVAENDGAIVVKKGREYFVKFEGADWMPYPSN